MARELTLENEITSRILTHKYTVIQKALVTFEHEGIYKHPFIKWADVNPYYPPLERAKGVMCTLVFDDTDESEERLDSIYKFCWEKIKDFVGENETFKHI